MKLATVRYTDEVLPGVVKDDSFFCFASLDGRLPSDMIKFVEGYDSYKPIVEKALENAEPTCALSDAVLLAPLRPGTLRDFVGFREHAENAGKRFGLDTTAVLEAWEKQSSFYYSNPLNLTGSGESIVKLDSSALFDFEFEVGFIIGKPGINIAEDEAMDHIFGLTIFNDWSARDLQVEEMKGGMGAPKAKEYANGLGPVIVTADELAEHLVPGDPKRYDLATKLYRNGELIRENNLKTIHYTFANMIAYASRDNMLHPGEVIGSGTVGGGAIIEYGPNVPFLDHGEVIDLEVEAIGTLHCVIE